MAKVLVVEDERAYFEPFERWLHDHEVTVAHTGEEALSALSTSIDVVLLDRGLPDMDGDAILSEIERRGIDCRVAMVTGLEPDFDVLEMGFDEYLVKPVSEPELRSVVDRLCTLSEYDEQIRRLYSMASRKAALEHSKPGDVLWTNPEYQALVAEFEQLKSRVDSAFSALIDEDPQQLIQ